MTKPGFPTFATLGDRAIVIHLGDQIDAITFRAVRSLTSQLAASPPEGMTEFVPAFTAVTVYYNPLRTSETVLCSSLSDLATKLDSIDEPEARVVEIPVCYGGEFGCDLEYVAEHAGLTPKEVVAIHAEGEYLVHMIGFAPGFPYLGGMSTRIAAPRRSSPRLKISAGSVGIAGNQTGIYPLETPGGWQLIGRTPLALFRPDQDPPTLLQAGDIVRFRPITPEQFRELSEQPA